MTALLAAIDVGTGSARAGLFTAEGAMVARAEIPIETHRVSPRMAAQDSAAIWRAVGAALRAARAEAGAAPEAVAALAFDATCSLVFRAPDGAPVGTLPDAPARWDTILWLDHRATAEAALCDATRDPALARRHGGSMSPEMALPKLLWMKRHMPAAWARTGFAFDLADFLAWRATGSARRSLATLTCKWTYLGRDGGWPRGLLAAIGLADLTERAGIAEPPAPPGAIVGRLTAEAAGELGLVPGVPVGAGMIDAYAGALGVLGQARPGDLALIGGTSTCVIANTPERRAVPSGWGPFPDVIFPGDWTIEVGQSVSGALLGHLTRVAPEDPRIHARIARRIAELRAAEPDLAPRLQILPDFHGNRAPLADPAALGAISGLDMGEDFDSLCRLYWRGSVALALALREAVEHLAAQGIAARRLRLAGGHARSPGLIALYADATGLPVVESDCDAVLLGTAMVAAVAAGLRADTRAAARAMARPGRERAPDPAQRGWLERDWRAFQLMRRQRAELDALLSAPLPREAVPQT
ncbi:MAG: ribulokinase [Rhodovulum sulfidophilum]|uniref:Ribulokinase n=1 Tax=Rhodovulum sulfidophilum TaxID=35806 RepID=A0A2W5NIG6_RHOSU|nr:MAG: ribulokinase [Rhodovulum sulfidophilum]